MSRRLPLRTHRAAGALAAFVRALVWVTVGLWASQAAAQTQVSGRLNVDTRWMASGSPYIVTADLTVDGGATLTIDPGVVVSIQAAARIEILSGAIRALGTPTSRIVFRSDKVRLSQPPAAGDWGAMRFGPGSSGSRLEHVLIEQGSGLIVHVAAPTFNHLEIRDHSAPAITIDLQASPAGVGLRAVGNVLNGVLVPPGDITGSVRWGLRGIPYVVASGQVSVGASPTITSIEPQSLEVGETITATVTGTRLSGLESATWSASGLTSQIQPGATDTQFSVALTASPTATLGAADLKLVVEAGEVQRQGAVIVRPLLPRLTAVSPTQVYVGRGATSLTISGQNFLSSTVAEVDDVPISTTIVSPTSASATLPDQATAGTRQLRLRTPDAGAPGGSVLTSALPIAVVLPKATLTPAPASLFAGNTLVMTLTLPFAAPPGGLTFDLASSAPLVVGVQSTVTVPAGSPSAQFDIVGAGVGTATVTVSRSGWASTQGTATVVDPPRRVDLTPILSLPVGIEVGTPSPAPPTAGPVLAPAVGVTVGSAAASMAPDAGVVGTSVTLTVQGSGLGAVSSVEAVPADGLTFSTPSGSGDGRTLTVTMTIAESAPKSSRRIVLRTASGEVPFVNLAEAQFLVTSPVPQLISIAPQVVVAGAPAVKLTVRGQNFRDLLGVRFEPAAGLSAVGLPTANGDGTQMEVTVQADAGAASGPRTMIVQSAAGESSAAPTAANTVQVARTLGTLFDTIVSPNVGLQVGAEASPPQSVGPVQAAPVGVLFGPAGLTMTPKSATRGERITLTLDGSGLAAVTGVRFEPDTGITVSGLSVTPDGRRLTATVDLDFNAPDTVRLVVFDTAAGPLPFANPAETQFQVLLIVGTRFESQVSPLVGLEIGPITAPPSAVGPVIAAPVGVTVGAAATSLLPDAGVVGTSLSLTVRGSALSAVTGVEAVPPDGLTIGTPVIGTDGRELSVPVTIAESAPKSSRRIVLRTASGELPFVNLAEAQFLVTAPVPQLISIAPQVIVAGAPAVKLTVRGQNFRDLLGVRFVPAAGLNAVGLPTANGDGTQMEVTVQADAGAASGPRTMIVQSAAGESSATPSAANTVQVARTLGTLFDTIVSPNVGLQVGVESPPPQSAGPALAPGVGVNVGPVVTRMSPAGSIKAVSGQWLFSGANLRGVDGVRFLNGSGAVVAAPAGVTVGAITINGNDTEVTIPYTVDAGAANGIYRLDLTTAGTPIPAMESDTLTWQVVDLPRIDSVSPNAMAQGRSYDFTVRGQHLGSVQEIVFEPTAGIQLPATFTRGSDGFGEFLHVTLLVAIDAPAVPRVVRLRFPGGLTSALPTAANTVGIGP